MDELVTHLEELLADYRLHCDVEAYWREHTRKRRADYELYMLERAYKLALEHLETMERYARNNTTPLHQKGFNIEQYRRDTAHKRNVLWNYKLNTYRSIYP